MADLPPIDAVITWVDGDDPKLFAKRLVYETVSSAHYEARRSTRFKSNGELEYCVASILQFAPFVRRIHVVTDGQTPAFITRGQRNKKDWAAKVGVVDHRDIFANYEMFLPTFCSCSIETMLHRIPGLAEHFISFNDDFLLLRQVSHDDFFENGKPVLRGRWRKQRLTKLLARGVANWFPRGAGDALAVGPKFWLAQTYAARLAGWRFRYFFSDHVPRPLRRTTLERIFDSHPGWLRKNISHGFRDDSQFFPPALANHVEIAENAAVLEDDSAMFCIEPAEQSVEALEKALDRARKNSELLFGCIQSLDEATPEKRALVSDWLTSMVRPLAM